MNIAVLSGKGGTGKTTLSTNLAYYISKKGYNTQYLDFDVEEPNGFIFLKPSIIDIKKVEVKVPDINKELCTGCGLCSEKCNFNALALVNKQIMFFEQICHSCGLCNIVCPNEAIAEVNRKIGIIERGERDNLICTRGVLDIGEPMGIPILRDMIKYLRNDLVNVIDAPPGSSCSVINSIEEADYCVLVTEPTKFGLSDLKIAYKVVERLGLKGGVVINRSDGEDTIIKNYCNMEGIPIIESIPYDKDIAIAYSKGDLMTSNKKFQNILETIISKIMEVE
ncbi:P-loop NTPase [Dethiothermospora halolimnae]|uniref:nucleotide-binding protein n=1 Tax=Dethiothermospora halolimnae TaxID=3114390 RepID=UPI003CCBB06C